MKHLSSYLRYSILDKLHPSVRQYPSALIVWDSTVEMITLPRIDQILPTDKWIK